MEGLETNKLMAAVLTAGIAFSVTGLIADIAVHPHKLDKTVLKIEGVQEAAPAAAAAPAPIPPIGPLMVKADPAAGEADVKKLCSVCHNFTEGGGAKVGPDLYNVVMRDRASMPGFDYSAALKGKPGKWTFDDLNAWLHGPKEFAPGTKMAFAGIDNDHERADVIDYLHTLSHDPAPMPPADEGVAKPAAPAAVPAPAAQAASPAPAGK